MPATPASELGAPRFTSRRRSAGVVVSSLGGALLLLGLGTSFLPNSVHVDTEYGEDVFFDCGLTLFPGTRPYEEPGISACRDYTEGMRDAALYFFAGGTLVLGSGGALLYLSRRRPSGNPT